MFECCTQDSTITFVVWNSSGSIIHKWNRHGISTTDWIPDGLGILHANLTVNATLANDGIHVACLIAGKSSNLAHLIVEQQENDTTGSGMCKTVNVEILAIHLIWWFNNEQLNRQI